jgi:hypothetical protein
LEEKELEKSYGIKGQAAYRLLSQRAYDAEGLMRDINSIQLKVK